MNPVERILDEEVSWLLDRLSASSPAGLLAGITESNPALRARLDDAETRLGEVRAAVLADYGRWRRALEDVENLWALERWRSAAAQEPVEQAAALAAA